MSLNDGKVWSLFSHAAIGGDARERERERERESNRKDHDVDFDVICVLAENPNVCDPG